MILKCYSITGTLLLYLIATTLAEIHCYKSGYTFDQLLGDNGDMTGVFNDFCTLYKDQEFEDGHHVHKCLATGQNHVDLDVTVKEFSDPSKKVTFTVDICEDILSQAKDQLFKQKCYRGGQDVAVSYSAPAKRSFESGSVHGDEGNTSNGHDWGIGDSSKEFRHWDGGETSDGDDQGDDREISYASNQAENEDFPGEGNQEDISGNGDAATIINFADDRRTTTTTTVLSITTSFTTTTVEGKKHKTSEDKYKITAIHPTESNIDTEPATETKETIIEITGNNTIPTTTTASVTGSSPNFSSPSTPIITSSPLSSLAFNAYVKMDPQAACCGC